MLTQTGIRSTVQSADTPPISGRDDAPFLDQLIDFMQAIHPCARLHTIEPGQDSVRYTFDTSLVGPTCHAGPAGRDHGRYQCLVVTTICRQIYYYCIGCKSAKYLIPLKFSDECYHGPPISRKAMAVAERCVTVVDEFIDYCYTQPQMYSGRIISVPDLYAAFGRYISSVPEYAGYTTLPKTFVRDMQLSVYRVRMFRNHAKYQFLVFDAPVCSTGADHLRWKQLSGADKILLPKLFRTRSGTVGADPRLPSSDNGGSFADLANLGCVAMMISKHIGAGGDPARVSLQFMPDIGPLLHPMPAITRVSAPAAPRSAPAAPRSAPAAPRSAPAAPRSAPAAESKYPEPVADTDTVVVTGAETAVIDISGDSNSARPPSFDTHADPVADAVRILLSIRADAH